MPKHVFMFDESKKPNTEEAQFLLGNKGAQLAEMTNAGLRVPYGFTITTVACNQYYALGKKWPKGLDAEVRSSLRKIERKMGKRFGDPKRPLFVSVRSGSYVSMPGMMDTVLNLGMNDATVEGFARLTKNVRAAYDSYRRFINMFGDVVMGVPHAKFEHILHAKKEERGVKSDTELSADDLKEVVRGYKELVRSEKGFSFPDEPEKQLSMGINAVFESWNSPRAISYRRINGLRGDAGTGVNVQAMVFGNMGEDSGTGVSFTRNPATGKREHYGEFLVNAQGEDVVAGIRTPLPIDAMKKTHPKMYKELVGIYERLERHYREVQDFEFTFEKGKLYLLQTRSGKRTAQAAVKIAVDMANEGLITREEAVLRMKPEQLDQLLHKQLDSGAKKGAEIIAKGLAASPGAAVGKVVFTAERATELAGLGEKVILVRTETSPEDIEGMHVAQGILTARGGVTSHAAVIARGMGKCCVAGCEDIVVSEENRSMGIPRKGFALAEGDFISLDGGTGEVFRGQLPLVEPAMSGAFGKLMKWADSYRKIGVRTNADTPKDAEVARGFGAEGIGLCRTEHMFFEGERIKAVREMILARDETGRRKALDKLLPFQRSDFEGIFRAMDGLPVIIRLLDPPLHEFLPKDEQDMQALAGEMGITLEKVKEISSSLHEFNPMLGHRGCRLGITYPEITEMQATAIFEAALNVKRAGVKPVPEIEVPLVGNTKEFLDQKRIIDAVAERLNVKAAMDYKVGTMFEVPRACIAAAEIAREADFISFGTNDLTQTTLGFSRDDAGKFIAIYLERGILERDPFQTIDQAGVGKLMIQAVQSARTVKPKIDVGICGEHGGDPASVEFCHRIGLSNVSCSPYRVPIARLAAAQAAIKERKHAKAKKK
ncbi:MAG: pyruvate, phosphate dikinase [Candidatus Diapherotrites archaeon]|uniref:pyruvate, phosphate dikinase n=1 Tax=Candidatus Iainarchaeum sp. TaxID=3101447 RepID=A0A8T3YM38_9ARCH|nr:pyruvate, phosphate dikinase [Candidatus Diapherotrites archaeon]